MVTFKGENNPNYKHGQREFITKVCPVCGKVFKRWKYAVERGKHYYCSRECARFNSTLFYSGKDSPFWRGGHPDFYLTDSWKRIRNSVKERWGNECIRCGYSGKFLDVHHIIPLKKRGLDNEFILNLILVCRKCHKLLEGKEIEEQFQLIFPDINYETF